MHIMIECTFLVHLSQRLKCIIVIMRRPSSLTFHIFDFSSETAKRNSTKLDRKQDLNILNQVCVFRANRKNKMAALASDWLRHFRLLIWNRWMELNETWQEARSQRPLPSLCFSCRSEKQDGHPGRWLAEIFSTSPLKPRNGIQRNLTGSMISMSSTKFVFFRPIGKTRLPPWPPIGWDIFDFSSETAKWNSTKLDRKEDLNVLYQLCVFGADRKRRWPPWPLIGWDIFDFSSETAERPAMKLDRKKDLNVLYQACVFWADRKNKMPPWPIRQKGGTLYSGARYVALWTSCYLPHPFQRRKCILLCTSVGRSLTPCTTDNSRTICHRSFKFGR